MFWPLAWLLTLRLITFAVESKMSCKPFSSSPSSTPNNLLMTFCDMTTGNRASFKTQTDGWMEKDGQTDVEVEIAI